MSRKRRGQVGEFWFDRPTDYVLKQDEIRVCLCEDCCRQRPERRLMSEEFAAKSAKRFRGFSTG